MSERVPKVVPFAEVFAKVADSNPPYPDGTKTALTLHAHQRRGGQIVEFAFTTEGPIRPPQRSMRANFISALVEWQPLTNSFVIVPDAELVIGHTGIRMTPYDPDAILLPREVLAEITMPPELYIPGLDSRQTIG